MESLFRLGRNHKLILLETRVGFDLFFFIFLFWCALIHVSPLTIHSLHVWMDPNEFGYAWFRVSTINFLVDAILNSANISLSLSLCDVAPVGISLRVSDCAQMELVAHRNMRFRHSAFFLSEASRRWSKLWNIYKMVIRLRIKCCI